MYSQLTEPINILKNWDYRCGENSVATTLAVTWGERILPAIYNTEIDDEEAGSGRQKPKQFAATASAEELLQPLLAAINDLENKFGNWKIPWGDINRFQRISGDINNSFDDSQTKHSRWLCIFHMGNASFLHTAAAYPGHQKTIWRKWQQFYLCWLSLEKK